MLLAGLVQVFSLTHLTMKTKIAGFALCIDFGNFCEKFGYSVQVADICVSQCYGAITFQILTIAAENRMYKFLFWQSLKKQKMHCTLHG